jgi:hypothetical protein|tara:strand:- start:2059 stop:3012 length:954 start_codon:yes stop_codon:yes gene_type:complete
MKGRVCVSVFFLVIIQIIVFLPSTTAQQILPGIDLECAESKVDINPLLENGVANIQCTLTNDRAYSEEVTITYDEETDLITTGPGSVVIEGGNEVTFTASIKADNSVIPELHLINITAEVTSAVGIPVGFITNIEKWEIEVEVLEYTSCDVDYGVSSLNIEAGNNAKFTSSYSCNSNLDKNMQIELHLVDKGASSEGMWSSGYNVISIPCSIQIIEGDGVSICEFEITTPSNINEKYEGCLVVLDERQLISDSCQVENSLIFSVEPKKTSLVDSGLGGNITILDDLDITNDELLIYAGGIGTIVIFLIGGLVTYRRR